MAVSAALAENWGSLSAGPNPGDRAALFRGVKETLLLMLETSIWRRRAAQSGAGRHKRLQVAHTAGGTRPKSVPTLKSHDGCRLG